MQLSKQEKNIIKALAEELLRENPDIKLVGRILQQMISEEEEVYLN